jgi:hypothetical protein
VAFAGDRATEILVSAREKLEARWPTVLAVIFLLAGVFVALLGVTGLVGLGHGRAGHFARGFRKVLHP